MRDKWKLLRMFFKEAHSAWRYILWPLFLLFLLPRTWIGGLELQQPSCNYRVTLETIEQKIKVLWAPDEATMLTLDHLFKSFFI